MKCDYCEIIQGREPVEIIHNDDKVIAFVAFEGITNGQLTVVPKEHFTILEMVPNNVLIHMADVANKLSASLFDSLGVQGTNIFIQNGLGAKQEVPHCAIQVIPRKENDGLKLEWEPKELSDFDMEDALIQITSNSGNLDPAKEEAPKSVEQPSDETDSQQSNQQQEKVENYLIKST